MRIHFRTSYDRDIDLFDGPGQRILYALFLCALVAMPVLLGPYLLGELTSLLIWAMAGLGLMLLVGQTGQISLGHAAFMALGAYAVVLLEDRAGLPFLVAFPLAGLICAGAGILLALPTMKLRGIYLAIATMAVAIMFEDILLLFPGLTGGAAGVFAPTITILGVEIDRYVSPGRFYWLVLLCTVLATLGYRNLLRSPRGRAFAAIRDSQVSASAMGIRVARYRAMAFGISTFVTGLAGALMAHFTGIVSFETFTIITSIMLLMQIVVGGLGSIHGAFIGAAVIVLLPQVVSAARSGVTDMLGLGSIAIPGLDSALFGACMILFILFEPRGIYGIWLKVYTWIDLLPLYRRDTFKRQTSYAKSERVH
ncbi:branched-chain amino acid ABC transporter permease [Chachezhania sediminis]|uniref:branched-chain amino acid ABC transporter permease n=1 Tax=Chachezhania sediminis TaxID=2599291 RepID=UPI00131D3A1D|nr:branched-chain amino acid ABC transporter permease [Chachezhania sediminis]